MTQVYNASLFFALIFSMVTGYLADLEDIPQDSSNPGIQYEYCPLGMQFNSEYSFEYQEEQYECEEAIVIFFCDENKCDETTQQFLGNTQCCYDLTLHPTTDQPSQFPTPKPEYVKATDPNGICPTWYVPIRTEHECEHAATLLGEDDTSVQKWAYYDSLIPSGCFIFDNLLRFNDDPNNWDYSVAGTDYIYVICKVTNTLPPTTVIPTTSPTIAPTTEDPTTSPTVAPTTDEPSTSPTIPPTNDEPSISPTESMPSSSPTQRYCFSLTSIERGNCAISNGALRCWGDDNSGQVSNAPTDTDFVSVKGLGFHYCGMHSNGKVTCWGFDDNGQVSNTPTDTFVAVSTGYDMSCALKSTGVVVCWGNNLGGQASPPTYTDFIAIACGAFHACGLRSSGAIVCWGADAFKQVSNAPTETDFVDISSGWEHSCGLKSSGAVVCWGKDYDKAISNTPTDITDFVSVSSMTSHNCGLRSSGALVCWGSNSNNKISDAPSHTDWVAVSGGPAHTCGLRATGQILCWGKNSFNLISDTPTQSDFVFPCDGSSGDGSSSSDGCDSETLEKADKWDAMLAFLNTIARRRLENTDDVIDMLKEMMNN